MQDFPKILLQLLVYSLCIYRIVIICIYVPTTHLIDHMYLLLIYRIYYVLITHLSLGKNIIVANIDYNYCQKSSDSLLLSILFYLDCSLPLPAYARLPVQRENQWMSETRHVVCAHVTIAYQHSYFIVELVTPYIADGLLVDDILVISSIDLDTLCSIL